MILQKIFFAIYNFLKRSEPYWLDEISSPKNRERQKRSSPDLDRFFVPEISVVYKKKMARNTVLREGQNIYRGGWAAAPLPPTSMRLNLNVLILVLIVGHPINFVNPVDSVARWRSNIRDCPKTSTVGVERVSPVRTRREGVLQIGLPHFLLQKTWDLNLDVSARTWRKEIEPMRTSLSEEGSILCRTSFMESSLSISIKTATCLGFPLHEGSPQVHTLPFVVNVRLWFEPTELNASPLH